MTLLTEHIEAGWHEVESFVGHAAEKIFARPGATSSVIRIEAETQDELHKAVTLRESQLGNAHELTKDTITNDGTLVTGEQHEALKTDGVLVPEQLLKKDEDDPEAEAESTPAPAAADSSEATPSPDTQDSVLPPEATAEVVSLTPVPLGEDAPAPAEETPAPPAEPQA
jgi:hypothetical protein